MSYYGRQCVRELDRLEADAEFWVKFAERLHPDEVRAVVAGDIGIIKRPLKPEWAVGEWMELASNFWIKPHEPKFTHRGWRITYDIRDFRVRLVRRVPAMFEPPDLDALGYPIEHDVEAIKAATQDGNYTSAAALAVPEKRGDGSAESVPADYDNVVQMQAKERWTDFKRQERAEEQARKDAKRLAATIRDSMLMLARNGGDLDGYVAEVARAAKSAEERKAA